MRRLSSACRRVLETEMSAGSARAGFMEEVCCELGSVGQAGFELVDQRREDK